MLFSSEIRAADDKKPVPARPALTVTTTTPRQASLPITLAANGSVAAWQEAIVGSEANGLRLYAVRVEVGDVVKAGQVLATFASETVQADLAQARASVAEAEASAADAAGNAERARSLQNTGAAEHGADQPVPHRRADHRLPIERLRLAKAHRG